VFLISIDYKKPLEVVDKYLAAHRDFLEEGYKKNYFIVSGPRNPRTGGIILSQLQDRKLLGEILCQDPFYIHGIAEYQINEFMPVKYHPDFAKFVSE